jgi:hypothetical protein
MVSRPDLESLYASYHSSELLYILRHPSEYTPLALEVAILEIHRRGLTPEDLHAQETADAYQKVQRTYFEPLTLYQMAMAYLAAPIALVVLGAFIFFIARHLRDPEATLLKRKQAGILIFLSTILLLGTYLLSLLMDSPYPFLLWASAVVPAVKEVRKAKITQAVVEVAEEEEHVGIKE